MLQQVKFFRERNISNEVLHKIARIAQHEFLKRDKVVFNKGSIGEKMYIVVDGEVSINLKNMAFILLKNKIKNLAD